MFWHFPTSKWTRSPGGTIRKGDDKLIEHFDDGRIELFNLAEDLGETVNLTRLRPERADELFTESREWRESVGALREAGPFIRRGFRRVVEMCD